MYEALSRLKRLTKLTMLEFDLTRPELGVTNACPLPTVTELTIVKTDCYYGLFNTFRYRTAVDDPEAPSDGFRVDQFLRVLFERFPMLRSLTIVGHVYQQDLVERAFQDESLPLRLVLLLEDKPISDDRTRQTARTIRSPRPHLYRYPIFN